MRPGLRAALDVAGNDLRRRRRDRSLLITAFVAPFALAMIINLAFGGSSDFSATIGVVDADFGAAGAAITSGLLDTPDDERGGVTFEPVTSEPEARAAVDDGDLSAALVVPAGFTAALGSTQAPPGLVVVQAPDQRIAGEVAQSIAGRFAASLGATRLTVATAAAVRHEGTGAPPSGTELAAWVTAATELAPAVAVEAVPMGTSEVDLTAYFAASMGIIFLFLGVGAGARSLLTERREGTLVRLLAAPVPTGSVLAGKAVSAVVVGVAGLGVLWGATTLVGADWGRPLPVALTIVATVLAIAGITTLVAGVARTEQAADGAAITLTFLFALLGGSFVPPGALPLGLQRLALVTPNGWALRAFTDLSADGAGLAEIWPALLVLAAIALGCGVVGYRRLQRVAAR